MSDTAENQPQNYTSPWLFGDKPVEAAASASGKRSGVDKPSNEGKQKSKLYQTSSTPADAMAQSLGPMAQSARAMQNMPVSARKPTGRVNTTLELSMDALGEAAAAHSQFSVQAISERKQRQLGTAVKAISPADMFCDSVVLSKEAAKVLHLYYFILSMLQFLALCLCTLLRISTSRFRSSRSHRYASCCTPRLCTEEALMPFTAAARKALLLWFF